MKEYIITLFDYIFPVLYHIYFYLYIHATSWHQGGAREVIIQVRSISETLM